MKTPRLASVVVPLTGLLAMPFPSLLAQSTVFWDVNGITAGGSAGTTADGVWGSSANNWGNASGNVATAAWVSGNHANFSAGTGVTGASLVTLDGTQTLGNLTVDEGSVTLSGGSLNFGTGARTLIVAPSALLTVNSDIAANGSLSLRGTATFGGAVTNAVSGNAIDIGTAATNARLNLSGGATFTAASGAIRLGVNGTASSGNTGALYQSGTGSVSVLSFTMGTASGTGAANSSYYRLSGSATLGASNLVLASAGATSTTAVFDQAGGTVNIGAFARITNTASGAASMNLTGGTFNFSGTGANNDTSFVVGYANGRGELNVRGSALLNLGTTALRVSGNAASSGFVSLATGGTIAASSVIAGGGSGALVFDGGTLRATAASANFIGTANNFVQAGGARIDSNGFNVTVSQALQAPSGDGVRSVAVANGGSGFLGAPLVGITGGGGSGATGYAVMSADGTQVVSIVITSPGSGYTSAPTVTLVGGGGTGAVLGTVDLSANTSGALTKTGAGILTLTAANTYAGGTFVNAGGIATSGAGSLGSGDVTVAAGASLTLGNAASIADDAILFFSQGASVTLSGGTESLGNIVLGSSGIVASGLYTADQLNAYFGLAGGNEVFFGSGLYNVAAAAIPEPSAWATLAGVACMAVVFNRRRR